ncbi:heterokaryon incompatibility protein-domain-containing protein [Immersiella caudata]|uniref:Heterokaryon incompatibility protein-domain-containing protein n=1 Tax=Immersiella caudata TaxID=314043 RepID=A0AA40CDB9_9PEZI|nr:heterokaryon incompatibility protein-domain-containing protein [Immersiella caudata]
MQSDPSNLYQPLDPPPEPIYPIRLLRIQRGWGHEDIICSFFESYPDQRAPAYKALSYRWSEFGEGMTYRDPQLLIEGHDSSAFEVGENLYAAIRQIRRKDQEVLLWADAICIDQKNKDEKGHQVQQMGMVYEAAEEVFIWLGSSTPDIERLFAFSTWIDQEATGAQAGITNLKEVDWRSLCAQFLNKSRSEFEVDAIARGLKDILARDWWKRPWILQEVAMARTAKIMCGSATCPARIFALLPSLMAIEVSAHTEAVLDIMPRLRKGTWWATRRDLHFLLCKLRRAKPAGQGTRYTPCSACQKMLATRGGSTLAT